MEKKKASAAHMRATAKWEEKTYDKVLLRLPKGTKALITGLGATVNGYINRAVADALERDGVSPIKRVPDLTTDHEEEE